MVLRPTHSIKLFYHCVPFIPTSMQPLLVDLWWNVASSTRFLFAKATQSILLGTLHGWRRALGWGSNWTLFLAPEEEEDSFGCGVLAGVGPETLGGGVCKALFLSEDFFSASINFSIICLFAFRGKDPMESS